MTRKALQRLAITYAVAVALACPSLLDAAEEEMPASPPVDAAGDAPSRAPAQPAPADAAAPAEQPPAAPAPPTSAAPREAPPGAVASSSEAVAGPPPTPPATESGPRARTAASASVTMKDFSFSPASVTVDVGDSVTWANRGREPHTATGDGFDTGTLDAGESGSAKFSRAGSFAYVCSIHPNMRGTVRVVASSRGGRGDEEPSAGGGESGGGSGSSADGSGSEGASGSATSASDRPALPATGLDAWLLGIAGVVLLAAGILLRERTRPA